MKKTRCLSAAAAVAVGLLYFYMYKKNKEEKMEELGNRCEKFRNYYYMLNQWMINKNHNNSVSSFFCTNGYRNIAVYGMGEMGQRFMEELGGSGIKVEYIIDRDKTGSFNSIPVRKDYDFTRPVDAVIVTATFAYKEVCARLEGRADCPIISLEDVINGTY